MKRKITFIFFTFLTFIFFSMTVVSTFGQSKNIVKVGNIYPGEVDFDAFTLSADSKIIVKGTAASFADWGNDLLFYGWILNSKTRGVVWHQFDDVGDYDKYRNQGLIDFEYEIELPKGDYEVYYASMYNRDDQNINSFGDFLDRVFSKDKKYKGRYREELEINVSGTVNVLKQVDAKKLVDENVKNAIVSFIRVGDNKYLENGFKLNADTKLRIYAMGEGKKRDLVDLAWIYDVDNSKKVWRLETRKIKNAGGGDKNVYIDEELVLPKGNYIAYYVTDDSHSYDEWNVLPPDDPQFYGLTIWTASENDLKNVSNIENVKEKKPIIELTRIRDNEFIYKGITLPKPMDLRVLCLGEASGRTQMADYGWIIDADSRETVWNMERENTENAGGSDKNRMVDQKIHLDKGNYIVYYKTDDSHSFNDWNTSPPYDQEKWGITIWAVNDGDRDKIKMFDPNEYKSENVIVEIVRARDNEYLQKKFSLSKDMKIRILAIGEGDYSEMNDYGWIEDAQTGKIVWEMTYRKTENAGGAGKNRMFNGVIMLPKGEYRVFYETDDSHSYRDWNDDPPNNEEKYGITLLYEK